MRKFFQFILIISSAFCLCACGDKGTEYTWGNITVNYPKGFNTINGSMDDETSKNGLTLENEENYQNYFIIDLTSEEEAKAGIEFTKEINSGEEREIKVNGVTWTGVYYKVEETPVWQVYANVEGNVFSVLCAGYEPNSSQAKVVLSTLHHS